MINSKEKVHKEMTNEESPGITKMIPKISP